MGKGQRMNDYMAKENKSIGHVHSCHLKYTSLLFLPRKAYSLTRNQTTIVYMLLALREVQAEFMLYMLIFYAICVISVP